MFGLMVQKGKFAASAFCVFVRALNSVDFPTLGIPTRPQDRDPPLKEASHALIENDRAEVARHKFRAILAAMVKFAVPGQVWGRTPAMPTHTTVLQHGPLEVAVTEPATVPGSSCVHQLAKA